MTKFLDAIIERLGKMLEWVGELVKAVFVALWDMFQDGVCWIADQFWSLVVSAMQGIDVSAVATHANLWASIPAGVLEVAGALGLGTAFGIISAAIGIRFVLQLIPFVRLGS